MFKYPAALPTSNEENGMMAINRIIKPKNRFIIVFDFLRILKFLKSKLFDIINEIMKNIIKNKSI